jgi:hypothetical protein
LAALIQILIIFKFSCFFEKSTNHYCPHWFILNFESVILNLLVIGVNLSNISVHLQLWL